MADQQDAWQAVMQAQMQAQQQQQGQFGQAQFGQAQSGQAQAQSQALALHEVHMVSVLTNLIIIAITVGVLLKALPLVRGIQITEDTKQLLVAEHGEDEELTEMGEGVTDEQKIKYQMERRLISGAIFWNTGSLETDFKFFCANRHPVLQFFAHCKYDGLGKYILFVIEANSILLGFGLQHAKLMMSPSNLPLPEKLLRNFVVFTLVPMLQTKVLFETLACPCQSSSAVGGHMSCCSKLCKFCLGPLLRVMSVLGMVAQIWAFAFSLPWDMMLAAFGGRCLGYLLFFPQNYVMWQYFPKPGFGQWYKNKQKAEALLPKKGIRGESCQEACCKVFMIYFLIAVVPLTYFVYGLYQLSVALSQSGGGGGGSGSGGFVGFPSGGR